MVPFELESIKISWVFYQKYSCACCMIRPTNSLFLQANVRTRFSIMLGTSDELSSSSQPVREAEKSGDKANDKTRRKSKFLATAEVTAELPNSNNR